MHYLLISDYYFPSVKSGAIIIGDLAEHISELGHQVTVITFSETQSERVEKRSFKNINILSIRSKWRNKNRIFRAISECFYSFQIKKLIKSNKELKFDYCICYSPSIFYGAALKLVRRVYNAPVYLIVRDIFPKWALDAGIIKKNLIYYFFKYVEKQLYENADYIGIESKNDMKYFVKYKSSNRVEVLNNWGSKIDIQSIPNITISENKKTQIIYGGNVGDAQDLLGLIKGINFKAIEEIAEITIIGAGDQMHLIRKYSKKERIPNLNILEQIPRSQYLERLKASDIGLVRLNARLKSNNFPLKMMGYLQLGMPILASVNSGNEIIELIEEHKIGAVSIAGDEEDFNNKLIDLAGDLQRLEQYKKNALSIFSSRFTVEVAVEQINRRLKV